MGRYSVTAVIAVVVALSSTATVLADDDPELGGIDIDGGSGDDSCDYDAVKNCIRTFGDVAFEHYVAYPGPFPTIPDLNRSCPAVSSIDDCVRNLDCTDDDDVIVEEWLGASKAYNELCYECPECKTLMLDECLTTDGTDETYAALRRCASTFNTNHRCETIKEFLECVSNAIVSCGEHTVNMIYNFYKEYIRPLANDIGCER